MPSLAYDLIIAAIVGGIPTYFAYTWKHRKPVTPLHLALGAVLVVVAYGSFVEPRMLVVVDYAADIAPATAAPAEKHTMTIAVISDMHLGTYRHAEWITRVVAAANARHPDMVLLAGDLASEEAGIAGFKPLADLESRYGTFAVLGNWDYRVGAVTVRRAIESQKVEVLTNESVLLGPPDAPLRLAGLDDLKYGKPDWDAALAEAKAGEPVVMLAHNPDAAYQAEVRGVPMVIAGHTHGGQIRLPFIGAVPPLPTKLGHDFDRGVLHMGPVTLFITPGVGESGPRARFLQPPEVSILHLTY